MCLMCSNDYDDSINRQILVEIANLEKDSQLHRIYT